MLWNTTFIGMDLFLVCNKSGEVSFLFYFNFSLHVGLQTFVGCKNIYQLKIFVLVLEIT